MPALGKDKSEKRLSPVVNRYFENWICQDSWLSFHPLDKQRFYRFVKAVMRYSRKSCPSAADIRALILSRRGELKTIEELDNAAEQYADMYETLLEYERTGDFPSTMIERTNIVRFHAQLTSHGKACPQYIDRVMSRVWGKDWQTRLNKALFPRS